jgi:ubiquinone/menaquinone biosynthesis C-methylase UbiE
MMRLKQLKAWESDYRSRARIWGGAPPKLPNLPEGSRVLELGCGSGKTLSAMLEHSWKVEALDISRQALRLSRGHSAELKKAPYEVNFIMADASQLPFRDCTFDAVFNYHVMGHLPIDQRNRMAFEAARVLKRGGKLFFLEFERQDMRACKGKFVEPHTVLRGNGILTHYFSEEEIFGLFDMLRPVSVETKSRKMKIMGEDHLRSQIEAVFVKDGANIL